MSNINFLLKRSNVASKRPTAAQLDIGELSLNYNQETPGLFFEDSDGTVRKVGPVEVSSTAPNSSPEGSSGNSIGELWYDTSDENLKIYDGTSFVAATATAGAGGSNTQVQFNSSGSLAGSSNFTFDGTNVSVSGTVTASGFVGNASTATTLQTARTINGTSFDGSANITTANWGTTRTLTIGSTGKSVNGSGDVAWSLAEIGVNDSTLTLATSGIATGSQTWTSNQGSSATFTVSVPGTNLGITAGSTAGPIITSSTGDNATLPAASASASGVVTTGNQTWAGIKTFDNTITGSISGNAGTATTLATSRTLWGQSFNGSANVTGALSNVGNITPATDNTSDLGSPSLRFANVYTGDLHLKNDRGDYTIIEEDDALTLRNNKTGKVYNFVLEERK